MPPIVEAERHCIIPLMDDNVVLMFILGDDAKPPIYKENITVTLNRSMQLEYHISEEMNETVLLVNISSAMPSDVGMYRVTAKTTAGSDTDRTQLSFSCEKNGMF